jgi:hypothetical protein
MSVNRKKICLEENGIIYHITSIYLLPDGSFKIDLPHCPYTEGTIIKFRYKHDTPGLSTTKNKDLIQNFTSNSRPQLSIHASGFTQFSGPGIISGVDENKLAKGVGIYSNRLVNPIQSGPTSIILFWGLENYKTIKHVTSEDILITQKDLHTRLTPREDKQIDEMDVNTYGFDFFVFPDSYEKYVSKEGNKEIMNINFPTYTQSPSKKFKFPICRLRKIDSFIGILPFRAYTGHPNSIPHGFVINGPAGSDKPNVHGTVQLLYSMEQLKEIEDSYDTKIITAFSYNKNGGLKSLDF